MSKPMTLLPEGYDVTKLARHAKTANEKLIAQAIVKSGGYDGARSIMDEVELHPRTIERTIGRLRDRAALHGYAPENDMVHEAPMTHMVSGVSSLYKTKGEDGKPVLQWVKTSQTKQRAAEVVKEVIEAFKEEMPTGTPSTIEKPIASNSELLNLHVISDYHLAMFAWEEENHDEDWNIEIAEKRLIDWFRVSLSTSPKAKYGILANLGDFLTSDSIMPVTPTHGHVLDVDSRFQYIIRSAIRIFRTIIEMMRQHYEHVHVLHVSGNHDLTSGMWLREMFATYYADYDDVTVDTSPDMYFAHKFGDVSLFFHHGHRRKIGDIAGVFIGKFRDIYGSTNKSYAHLGHRHSIEVKENNTMVVEQHRTLAPADAHASGGGWLSGRSSYVITYHKKYGEIGRTNIPMELIQDIEQIEQELEEE